MTENSKRTAALNVLAATGMWRSSYAPPGIRLLWRLGFDVPPPHFVSFRKAAIVTGTGFAIGFGLAMWAIEPTHPDRSLSSNLIRIAISAAIFGYAMALYYADGRRRYDLPSWESL